VSLRNKGNRELTRDWKRCINNGFREEIASIKLQTGKTGIISGYIRRDGLDSEVEINIVILTM